MQQLFKWVHTYRRHLLLNLVVLIWGYTGVITKLSTLSASSLVCYRMLIAASVLAGVMFFMGISFRLPQKSIFQLVSLGGLLGLQLIAFNLSIKVSNVSVCLACFAAVPLFACLLEPVITGRRLNPLEAVFGIIACGALWLIFSLETRYLEGVIYGLGSALLLALFTVCTGLWARKHHPAALTFYQLSGAAIVSGLYLFVDAGVQQRALEIPNGKELIYLFTLGVLCSAFTYLIMMEVMKELSPFTVCVTLNLEPVYAIAIAIFHFGSTEYMSTGFYFGSLLLIGVVYANLIVKERARPALAREPVQEPTEA